MSDDQIAEIISTLRKVGADVDAEQEFPSMQIEGCARDGYALACYDIADAFEKRSIAGGILRPKGDPE